LFLPGRKNGSLIGRLGTTESLDTDERDEPYEKLLIRLSRLVETSPGITSVPPSRYERFCTRMRVRVRPYSSVCLT
jgi:hypothetical protein